MHNFEIIKEDNHEANVNFHNFCKNFAKENNTKFLDSILKVYMERDHAVMLRGKNLINPKILNLEPQNSNINNMGNKDAMEAKFARITSNDNM